MEDLDNPTLAFTMWDVATDKSYLVDLEIDVIEFNENPEAFRFNVIELIGNKLGKRMDITSVKNFRWSVVGGIYGGDEGHGYIASYNNKQPYADTLNDISQRIFRMEEYFKSPYYSAGPHKVLVRESGDPKHYLNLWQGSFNGLSPARLEARAGFEDMTLWSIFATGRFENVTKELGRINLQENGVLIFQPN